MTFGRKIIQKVAVSGILLIFGSLPLTGALAETRSGKGKSSGACEPKSTLPMSADALKPGKEAAEKLLDMPVRSLDLDRFQKIYHDTSEESFSRNKLELAQDIPAFCRATAYLDYVQTVKDEPVFGDVHFLASWRASFELKTSDRLKVFSSEDSFSRIFGGDFSSARAFFEGKTGAVQREEIENRITAESAAVFEKPISLSQLSDPLYRLARTDGAMKSLGGMGLCLKEFTADTISCSRGISDIVTKMSVASFSSRGSGPPVTFALPDLYEKVLTSPSHQKVLRLAASKVLGHVERLAVGDATLWGDLISAGKEAGLNPDAQAQVAMEILGLWSTGGSSAGYRALGIASGSSYEARAARAAMMVIGYAIPVLDSVSQEKHTYSIPPTVKSRCDSSKPYHFWLSAYLAYYLAGEKKYSERGSAAAAFLSDKGYQLLTNSAGRLPAYPYSNPSLSAYNNVIRIDLAMAATGGQFGAALAKNRKFSTDLDSTIKETLRNSGNPPLLSRSDARDLVSSEGLDLYGRFSDIFGGNAAFEASEKFSK
jgi:hypothetical protein